MAAPVRPVKTLVIPRTRSMGTKVLPAVIRRFMDAPRADGLRAFGPPSLIVEGVARRHPQRWAVGPLRLRTSSSTRCFSRAASGAGTARAYLQDSYGADVEPHTMREEHVSFP